MSDHRFEEYCLEYTLRTLPEEQVREMEGHLQVGCARCEAELREIGATLADLPYALSAQALPSDLKERTMKKIEAAAAGAAAVRGPGTGLWRVWAIAASLAAIVLGWQLYVVRRNTDELRQQIAGYRDQIEVLQQASQELDNVRRLISDPSLRVVQMKGLQEAPEARGYVFVTPPSRQAIVYFWKMPALTAGRIYELWTIDNSQPRKAGLFSVDRDGFGKVNVSSEVDLSGVDTWAVTGEPEGGVESPTGTIVIAGAAEPRTQ
ncbi:MAG: anti-sigma factor [Acidobacteriota bacterium]